MVGWSVFVSSSFSPPHTRSTMSVSAKTESKHENVRYEYMFLQRLANPPFQLPQWNEKVQVEDFGGNVQTRRNSLRFSVPCSTTETTVFSVLVVHPVNLCLGLLVNPAPSASSMLDCPNALYWDCHGQLHINQKAQTSGSLTHPFYANLSATILFSIFYINNFDINFHPPKCDLIWLDHSSYQSVPKFMLRSIIVSSTC